MGREVNPKTAAFLKVANSFMQTRFGVGYLDVVRDLEGDDRQKAAIEGGVSAVGFAQQLASEGKFVRISGTVPAGKAGEINKRRAALAAFARQEPEWVFEGDGNVYREVPEGGVVRLSAEALSDDKWGFQISHAPDGELRPNRPPQASEFEQLGVGMDIRDALEAGQNKLDLASENRFGM